MNTNRLQGFAAEARVELIRAVRAKLDAAMEPDSAARVDDPGAFARLQEEIRGNGGGEQGRARTAERHAYRWFNRIVALRYMDANGFTSPHVVSGDDADNPNALPEVLSAAKRGEFDEDVFGSGVGAKTKVVPTIVALLDGSKPSNDPQGDAYGLLLRAYCDYWHRFLPFMFDEAGAADGILMPADLLASDSILRKAVTAMTVADCVGDEDRGNVEIIGWLYQFYIADRKDEVMAGFKKSKKAGAAEIPAATQLFTPDWIVRYLVQNTVGRLWTQSHPESQLWRNWEYYIAPQDGEAAEETLHIDSPEELTVCDPACGSGHMLTYAFDLLYDIYDEGGYSANEIPGLILKHNLYGMEIDERAANLAAFALTMKARGRYRRFFRKGRQVQPNIQRITPEHFTEAEVEELNELYDVTFDADTWNTYQHADVYGSLIQPDIELATLSDNVTHAETSMLFDEHLIQRGDQVLTQTAYLARKYAAVVANPPYMGSSNMGADLKKYVTDHYKDGKSDLFAAFILRNLQLIRPNALLGMITMQSWMFEKSFEELRARIIRNMSITSLMQLGIKAFESIGNDVVQTCAFVVCNRQSLDSAVFIKLDGYKDSLLKKKAFLEGKKRVITHPYLFDCIPGKPLTAYVADERILSLWNHSKSIEDYGDFTGSQNITANNDCFVRFHWEINSSDIAPKKWVPYAKGGDFRRYFGNIVNVVNWTPQARRYYEENPTSNLLGERYWYKEGITYSAVTSRGTGFRYLPEGCVFDKGGASITVEKNLFELLSLLNSKLAEYFFHILNPSINLQVRDIKNLPIMIPSDSNLRNLSIDQVEIAKKDWNDLEISLDYTGVQWINLFKDEVMSSAVARYLMSQEEKYDKALRNMRSIDDIYYREYGLSVPVSLTYEDRDIPVRRLSSLIVVKEIISYAVGCLFGRYSLDKPGLILASQGETLDDYHAQVPNPSFEPDADNVIPVTDDEWFEDDIAARFRDFLAVACGEKHLSENIAYIEQVLGKPLRKYFATDFYDDHVRMYKNRPIYWMYSSRTDNKGAFKALVYLHRYTPATTNTVLKYLREFSSKLTAQSEALLASSKVAETRKGEKLRASVKECNDYERDILYPLATRNLPIDLDDGVLVNYLRMGHALRIIKPIEAKRKTVQSWTWPTHSLES
ncbi:BREX-1 system adenine-specific DNA-methyltransferase PglX [Bifidobacterium platyrrhinorum]|uniref:site-specific DNA-methyltransferase (adenine-specific) n=1 Tax=Bifidobacterium platyrrhinorum TaxID=2661628 RepID=A0A6L9SQL4_9BIFI|nr:BREX-1 system adenine-specific DNA-methyltransferase PglX [Bifidobacterium platyrrhinorum]NEG54810.1 BREX-1 system adenine-specific DNA-methyltransferase PglX [Bifidobacterium platyrrhinorum]